MNRKLKKILIFQKSWILAWTAIFQCIWCHIFKKCSVPKLRSAWCARRAMLSHPLSAPLKRVNKGMFKEYWDRKNYVSTALLFLKHIAWQCIAVFFLSNGWSCNSTKICHRWNLREYFLLMRIAGDICICKMIIVIIITIMYRAIQWYRLMISIKKWRYMWYRMVVMLSL